MQRFSLFALVATLLVSVTALIAAEGQGQKAEIGKPAPAFSLTDQTGKTHDLADYKGKVVVLEWFNEGCPYVQKHYTGGDMNRLADKYEDQGVVWLAVNTTAGKSSADNSAVAQQWNIDRPILDDSEGNVGRAYGAKTTPHMFVIDKEGKLVYAGAIDSDRSADQSKVASADNYVASALDETLAGKTVSQPETKPYGCSVKYKK